jgi:hypothetical protein
LVVGRVRRSRLIALGLLALAALAALGAGVARTRTSTAAFTTTSSSRLEATADHVHRWLNLYSSATDPQSEIGYADQVGNPAPAATGQDEDLVVDFDIPGGGNYTHSRVCKVRTADAYPETGVSAVTVTVTIAPDPATGLQPVSKYGVDAWGAAPTYTKTIAGWGVGTRRQLNLQTKFPGKKYTPGTTYEPTVIVTLTFTGLTTAYYQYSIPIRIHYM